MEKQIISQVIPYLEELHGKIEILQLIGRNLSDANIQIKVTFDTGDACYIDQKLIPFNMAMEVKALVNDSIDEYQRMAKHLNELANAQQY
jgi:hypothetical protein